MTWQSVKASHLITFLEAYGQLDLRDDSFCHNEQAVYLPAVVFSVEEFTNIDGESWITLDTSQGMFQVPANHLLKVIVS